MSEILMAIVKEAEVVVTITDTKTASIAVVLSDTFEKDGDGDIMPKEVGDV